jgi:hypothetical protein
MIRGEFTSIARVEKSSHRLHVGLQETPGASTYGPTFYEKLDPFACLNPDEKQSVSDPCIIAQDTRECERK